MKTYLLAIQGMDVIVIVNKTDLPQKINLDRVRELASSHKMVTTSLLEESGVDELEEAIAALFFAGSLETGDLTYVSNARHIALLGQALKAINDAIAAIEMGTPVDLVQIDFTKAWELLGEIIGETIQDDLLNQLFSQFCLGK